MQLYQGSTKRFVEDAVQNRIAGKLRDAFEAAYRFSPGPGEVRSWQNSLARMCNVVQHGGFLDHGILLEYQLPLTSRRLDCMLTGSSDAGAPNAVVVELKQWDDVQPSSIRDCVVTPLGGRLRDVLHPSRQVGNYSQYLADCHAAFHEGGIAISACSYLHNLEYSPENELFHARHAEILDAYPAFAGDRSGDLESFLRRRVGRGDPDDVLGRVVRSPYRPAKRLLDHVARVIRGQRAFVLLDEQQVVFNAVLGEVERGLSQRAKSVVLVRGGPGTGKSVVAMHLVGELSGRGFNAQHATGSKAFTENVRRLVGSRAAAQFRYFNGYVRAESGTVDVLVLDEAHRLRETSADRFQKKADRPTEPQIDELMRAAKVIVAFIDDLQVVRPGEVGSSQIVLDAARRAGATRREFQLEAQFRCAGSDGFINWVDNTLGIRRTANVLWDSKDAFEVRICDSPRELESCIRGRAAEGYSARLVSGFCFPWSDPKSDGTLVHDVVAGDWSMPWNAKPDSTRLAPGVPKSIYWASDPAGLDQVGCVYTAQGFEFDYVGVIVGPDLRYDPTTGTWVGDRSASYDSVTKRSGDRFARLVRQVYRVLLTRGMKGCYLYFLDGPTRDFVRSRIE